MNAQQRWRNAVRDSDVGPAARLVALILDTYMSRDGVAWPSRRTLAHGCRADVKTVDRALSDLAAAGLIEIRRSRGRIPNEYHATATAPHRTPLTAPYRTPLNGPTATKQPSQRSQIAGPTVPPQVPELERELVHELVQVENERELATRTNAAAYTPFVHTDIAATVDNAMLELAKSWLERKHP